MLTLVQAQDILAKTLAAGREKDMRPLTVAVLDERGVMKALASEDGSPLLRPDIAFGKAYGAVAMGSGTRRHHAMAVERPHFIAALNGLAGGALIPVPGGVLIKDAGGAIVGAVGVTGDTSDNDEIAAVAGITGAGFKAETGG